MDTMHLTPGGEDDASRPTEQFWYGSPGHGPAPGPIPPGYGAAPAPHAYGPGGGPVPGGSPGHGQGPGYGGAAGHGQGPWYGGGPVPGNAPSGGSPRGRRKALLWGAGTALAALLAAGGIIAGVSVSGRASSPGMAPSALAGSAAPAGPAGQAAVLNAALNSAGSSTAPSYLDSSGAIAAVPGDALRRCLRARAASLAAGRPRLARGIRRACRPALRRLLLRRLALRGVEGQFTFRTASGLRTLAFERGTIESVSGQEFVLRAADGTTWTWHLTASTVLRENGEKTSSGALAAGEQAWAGGPVVQGARDARLVVIRPPGGSAPAGS
jgi:hypothetical protein